jgi:mycofactocin precursor
MALTQEVRMTALGMIPPADAEAASEDGLAAGELLVEEISIDGMCGVY